RIVLIVLFVIGIGICTWSIYRSLMTISQNSGSSAAEQTGKNSSSQSTGKTGSPTIIDNGDNSSGDNSDADTEDTNKNTNGTGTQTNGISTQKYTTYTVKKDETLKNICTEYSDKCPSQVLSKAIMSANNLKSTADVKEGMELKIPDKYLNGGIKYTVMSGDSLSSIATKYMKDVKLAEAIKALEEDNFLSSDSIRVGDQLFVASTESSEVSTNVKNESKDQSTSTMSNLTNRTGALDEYTVKDGESLAAISDKFGETCPQKTASNIILKINGLSKSTDIKAGMKIKLPDKYLSEGEIYTVAAGDTLYDIVSKNMADINVNDGITILTEDNGISNSVIIPGQKLFIASVSKQ
ncbi:MAG: LysM peptidoglycan-binding domain-containing protein, partial [Bacillota bacterium]|nr:LysM peptidoglycan-binding domain-containing protein [Bacillota bacterium]